jgi:hypothetical protein
LIISSKPYYQNFFNCAEYIEEEYNRNSTIHKKIVWYFISDSLSLRKDAYNKYGSKIITNLDDLAVHSATQNNENPIRQIMSEILTFALCDYFIISYDSGVGRLGAFLSENKKTGNVFMNDKLDKLSDENNIKQCWAPIEHDILSQQGCGV